MKLKIYWYHSTTENKCDYDDEENPVYYRQTTNKLEMVKIDSKDIKKEFEKEDDDGDDSGSWCQYIQYVTKWDGTIILYDHNDKDMMIKEIKRDTIDRIYYMGGRK